MSAQLKFWRSAGGMVVSDEKLIQILNKLTQTQWLKTTWLLPCSPGGRTSEGASLAKRKVPVGWVPAGGPEGESVPLTFPAAGGAHIPGLVAPPPCQSQRPGTTACSHHPVSTHLPPCLPLTWTGPCAYIGLTWVSSLLSP